MAINTLMLARMAEDAYRAECRSIDGWLMQDLISHDNFHARAYKHPRASLAVIAFRGTASTEDAVVEDLLGIGLSLNALALELNSAIDFTGKMKSMFKDVWLTGHSLGGAYVQLISAICELPGYTFNAPGVLNLLHQMSPNLAVKLCGGLGGGVMSFLTGQGSDVLTKVAAGYAGSNGEPVQNFRSHVDPVSLIGVHVGAPLNNIEVKIRSPRDTHSITPLVEALSLR